MNIRTVFLASFQDQVIIKAGEFTTTEAVHDFLLTSKIIPEVLDDFVPSIYPDVSYPNHDTVRLGSTLHVNHVSRRPVFTMTKIASYGLDPTKIYTLILTDPDATSRSDPKWSEMCHWILTNITAPAQTQPGLSLGPPAELIEYLPPSPPKRTGRHRYVFVLLSSASTDIKAPEKRKHWGYKKVRHGVRDWAAENNLTVVGANFFYAQNEKQ